MTKSEKNQIIKWANTLTNDELESEYYKAAWDCLGSEAEEMYERGWDIVDILEREKFEKWLCQKSHLLGTLCEERGIRLWEDINTEETFVETSCETCAYYDTDRDDMPCCSCFMYENWERCEEVDEE